MKKLLLTFYTTSIISAEQATAIAKELKAELTHYNAHMINIVIEADNNAVKEAFKQAAKYELTLFIKH